MCRIADLGRFRFEHGKRSRDAKKHQDVSEVVGRTMFAILARGGR